MKNALRYSLIIFLAFLCLCGYTQDKDCKRLLRENLAQMSSLSNPGEGQVYYMNMRVQSDYKEEAEARDSDVEVKMYLSQERMQYESSYISFYKDDSDAIMLIHPQKTVLWTDAGKTGEQTEKYTSVLAMNDSLLKYSDVLSCRDIAKYDRELKEITLKSRSKFSSSTGIDNVTYYYDLEENRLYKTIVRFSDASPKNQEVITYNQVDFDHKKMPFNYSWKQVMSRKGVLLSRYMGYQLIDNRN